MKLLRRNLWNTVEVLTDVEIRNVYDPSVVWTEVNDIVCHAIWDHIQAPIEDELDESC